MRLTSRFSVTFTLIAFVFTSLSASGAIAADEASYGENSNYEQGIALYLQEKYAPAVEAFTKHLDEYPDHEPSKEWIGLIEALGPIKTYPSAGPEARKKAAAKTAPVVVKTKPAPDASKKLRLTVQNLKEEILKRDSKLASHEQSIKAAQAGLQKEKAEADRLLKVVNDRKAEAAVLKEQQKKLQIQHDLDQTELRKLRSQIDALKKKPVPAQAAGSAELAKLKTALKEKESETKRLAHDLDIIKTQVLRTKEQNEKLLATESQEVTGFKEKLSALQREAAGLKTSNRKLVEDLQEKELKLTEANLAKEKLEAKLKTTQTDLSRTSHEKDQAVREARVSAADAKAKNDYERRFRELQNERASMAAAKKEYEEGRLDLQKTVDKLEGLRKTELASSKQQIAIVKKELISKQTENQKLSASLNDSEAALDKLRKELNALRQSSAEVTELKEQAAAGKKASQEAEVKLAAETRRLEGELLKTRQASQQTVNKLTAEVKDLKSNLEKSIASLAKSEGALTSAEARYAALDEKSTVTAKRLTETQLELKSQRKALATLEAEHKNGLKQIDMLKSRNVAREAELDKELKTLKTSLQTAKTDLAKTAEKQQAESRAKTAAEKELKQAVMRQEALKTEITSLQKTKSELTAELAKSKKSSADAEKIEGELLRLRQSSQSRISALSEDLKTANEEIKKVQADLVQSAATEAKVKVQYRELLKDSAALQTELKLLSNEMKSYKNLQETIARRDVAQKKTIEGLQQELENGRAEIVHVRKELKEAAGSRSQTEKLSRDLEISRAEAKQLEKKLREEAASNSALNAKLNSKITDLENAFAKSESMYDKLQTTHKKVEAELLKTRQSEKTSRQVIEQLKKDLLSGLDRLSVLQKE